MNSEIENGMKILMGRGVKNNMREITSAEREKIARAHTDLFFGLAGANWARGASLGAAWYQALTQIKSMLGAKDKNNPVTAYLGQIHAAHNVKWSQMSMTHPAREEKNSISPDAMPEWNRANAQKISNAMATINQMIEQCRAAAANTTTTEHAPANASQSRQKSTTEFATAQQALQKKIIAYMMQHQTPHTRA